MKVTVEINNFADAAKAIVMLTALIQASVEEPAPPAQTASLPKRRKSVAKAPAKAPVRSGRKSKHEVAPAVTAAPEPAEEGVAAVVEAPVEATEPIEETREEKASTTVVEEPVEPAEPIHVEPVEVARERLRNIAKEKGVLWYRELLAQRDVPSIFEMPESTIREVLRAVEGEPA